ncbi:helix-turn-helix transcriptional regulator [Oxalobacteraceae bacterium]|nr:helix-turn-helix transcriptional regulator [Oxalobacteraceae bacterium]
MRHNFDFSTIPATESALRLGARIRLARKAQRLTLLDLERVCRIHRTTLGRLERGDLGVSLGLLLSVLEALGELADVELLLSQPDKPAHQRGTKAPILEQEF